MGPFEALFRLGEWKPVRAVGELRQLTDLGAVEYSHGVVGHSVDLFEGLLVDYIPDRWPYPPERVDRLHAELRAEWVAQGRGDEVDRPTFGSQEEFWRELKRRLQVGS